MCDKERPRSLLFLSLIVGYSSCPNSNSWVFFLFVEVGLFVDILGTRKLWKLNHSKRVQLVYVFQSKFYSKARQDYLDVSKVYSQVITWQPVIIK